MSSGVGRRDFLRSATGLAAGLLGWAALPGCGRARTSRILVLGGTNYVGPHLVRTALAGGHEVTLFNRGVTNPDLFPQLETLRGNRYPDRDEGLAALEGIRTWDAVIDTWQGAPGCVDVTARTLADRVARYVYVSSIATYGSYREPGITEEGPLLDASEHVGSFDPELGYPTRKRAAELTVEHIYGPRGTVLRCGSIQGPSDAPDTESEIGYWPYRFLLGEPLLAPDDPTARFQLIDVRDLAAFAARSLEEGLGGAFNMVGPEEPLTFPDYLRAWGEATGHRSPIVWAGPDWLIERGIRPWSDIPNWIPGDDPEPGFYRLDNRKALAHGLACRPLIETVRDGVASLVDRGPFRPPAAGLGRDRELELVEAWRARAGAA